MRAKLMMLDKTFLIVAMTPPPVKRGDRNLALSVREYGVPRDSSPINHPCQRIVLLYHQ